MNPPFLSHTLFLTLCLCLALTLTLPTYPSLSLHIFFSLFYLHHPQHTLSLPLNLSLSLSCSLSFSHSRSCSLLISLSSSISPYFTLPLSIPLSLPTLSLPTNLFISLQLSPYHHHHHHNLSLPPSLSVPISLSYSITTSLSPPSLTLIDWGAMGGETVRQGAWKPERRGHTDGCSWWMFILLPWQRNLLPSWQRLMESQAAVPGAARPSVSGEGRTACQRELDEALIVWPAWPLRGASTQRPRARFKERKKKNTT